MPYLTLSYLILLSMILYAFLMLRHFSTFVDCFPRKFYTIFIHFLNCCTKHYLSPAVTPHKYTPKKQVKNTLYQSIFTCFESHFSFELPLSFPAITCNTSVSKIILPAAIFPGTVTTAASIPPSIGTLKVTFPRKFS